MSDPVEVLAAETFDIDDSPVSITIVPLGGGRAELTAKYAGEVLEKGEYRVPAVFGDRTERGTFLNLVEDAAERRPDADPAGIRSVVKDWLAEFNDLGKDEQREHILPGEVNAIRDGTEYPVFVYPGEPTTWEVTITYHGKTSTLEFATSEILNDSGGALEEKIANDFFEIIEIESDDWKAIRDEWVENKKVVDTGGETKADAVAERVLALLAERAQVVDDRDVLGNDPKAVWLDQDNSAGYDDAPADGPVAWVQSGHLVDELERAGKALEYKGQLVKDLIARGDLYGSRARRRWVNGTRSAFYPFDPDALGIDEDDITPDEPAHSEVDP